MFRNDTRRAWCLFLCESLRLRSRNVQPHAVRRRSCVVTSRQASRPS